MLESEMLKAFIELREYSLLAKSRMSLKQRESLLCYKCSCPQITMSDKKSKYFCRPITLDL